jgi:hypothetical protein
MKLDFCINDTVLFKQVAKVVGEEEALRELTIAFENYTSVDDIWSFDDELNIAFIWEHTPRGHEYWNEIDDECW